VIFTKVPKIDFGEKTFFSTNGARKTGYSHAENRNQIPISHPVQKSIGNGSKTLISDLKLRAY
jgi:hypothetical protein